MEAALRSIRAYLSGDLAQLRIGKPMDNFGGMRPRELLANWLVCAATYAARPDAPLEVRTDPFGGDGVLYDQKNKVPYRTEHVFVPPAVAGESRSIEELLGNAVAQKQANGLAYASRKTLILLLAAYPHPTPWDPTKAARMLPPHDFAGVWVAGGPTCRVNA
jgi:hypothetical protein